jgi:microcystin-dependent protein
MSQPYIGECRLVGFNFQVNGWNFCNGAIVSIASNDALFNLLGTTYGGDGQQTFALPDLRGRVPVHQGAGFVIGQTAGVETVTLTGNQMPIHTHTPRGSGVAGATNLVQNNLPASNSTTKQYVNTSAVSAAMNPAMIGQAGGSQPHENMQPFLTMNWIISLFGVFPTQS